MVVISGKYRKRVLLHPQSKFTRPTMSFVKESIFNSLNNYFIFENKQGFDLFAGSGQLGIEALSRGLKHCVFNDYGWESQKCLKANTSFIASSDYEIYQLDFMAALKQVQHLYGQIDILFLDPPYKNIKAYDQAFDFVIKKKLLNKFGVIVTTSAKPLQIEQYINYFELLFYNHNTNKHWYILRWNNIN